MTLGYFSNRDLLILAVVLLLVVTLVIAFRR